MENVGKDKELYYREYTSLREELNNIKKAQLWLINVAIASTGILLGVGGKDNSPVPFAAAALFPLIITLPCWYLFFDKATAITRIIGYLKVLEKLIIEPDLARSFTGWENALVIFRGRQQQKILQQKKIEVNIFKRIFIHLKEIFRFFHSFHSASVRFWWICQVIFFLLSWLCLLLSLSSYLKKESLQGILPMLLRPPFEKLLFFVILIAAIWFSSYRNFKYLCFLAWGRYSSRVNEFLWKQIILKKMILEHERLLEYGNDGCAVKENFSRRLFKRLIKNGYIGLDGKIQPALFKLENFSEMNLGWLYRNKREKIYNLLRGCPWRVKALNFEGRELDFSDYRSIFIRINSQEERNIMFKVQLIHSLDFDAVNSVIGLAPDKYTLSKGDTDIIIPLEEFRAAGADLQRIHRLVIHYGKRAFGKKLNAINTARITVKEIVLN